MAFSGKSIDDENCSIMENNTWVLSDLPPGCKPLGSKWIFKRKMKVDGIIDKFKARLVIQGFRQKEGIDYFNTYAPVARITTIRLLLALAAIHNLVTHQMDVKTAFLNGDLEEEVYMKQPEGFVMPGNEHKTKIKLIKLKRFLSSRFLMKDMGETDVILGIKIKRENKRIVITQSHYIEKILKKFNCEDCSLVSTPMNPVEKLKPNTCKLVDQLEYSRAIGCLMYVMTRTRPDIAYAVGRLSRFTSNPSRQHWQAKNKGVQDSSSKAIGWVFLLGGGCHFMAVRRKQTCITGSTMESEFVALAAAGARTKRTTYVNVKFCRFKKLGLSLGQGGCTPLRGQGAVPLAEVKGPEPLLWVPAARINGAGGAKGGGRLSFWGPRKFILLGHLYRLMLYVVKNIDDVLCIKGERQALIEFKQGLIDEADRLASWVGEESDCCKWDGIVCDDVTGHVYEIHLRALDGGCQFTRTIPPQLGNLSQLNVLSLGPSFERTSVEVYGGCPSLHQLHHLGFEWKHKPKSVVVVRPVNTRHRWDETCLLDIIVIKSTDVVGMALPVQNINHSAFRSMFEKEKLSGNNFNDWFARLKLVLRVEKKMHVIEQPLPPAPEAGAEPNIVAQWTALYDAHTEIACLMLGSMTPELHRQFELRIVCISVLTRFMD
ncbi:zinc finger, CCHC-type containing protein [Tanacetum coccineum]